MKQLRIIVKTNYLSKDSETQLWEFKEYKMEEGMEAEKFFLQKLAQASQYGGEVNISIQTKIIQ